MSYTKHLDLSPSFMYSTNSTSSFLGAQQMRPLVYCVGFLLTICHPWIDPRFLAQKLPYFITFFLLSFKLSKPHCGLLIFKQHLNIIENSWIHISVIVSDLCWCFFIDLRFLLLMIGPNSMKFISRTDLFNATDWMVK